MAKKVQNAKATAPNGANVGYEAELWCMADALHSSIDAAEYQPVIPRILSHKTIFDSQDQTVLPLQDPEIGR